jgi:uncharacterized protein YlxW (UPF0749 family)
MMTTFTQAENAPWNLPFSQTEWAQTPGAVQTHLLSLQAQLHDLQQQQQQLQIQIDQLQGRLDQTSKTWVSTETGTVCRRLCNLKS